MNGLKIGTDRLQADHVLGSHRSSAPIWGLIRGLPDFFASLEEDGLRSFDGLQVSLELRNELIRFKERKHPSRTVFIPIFSHTGCVSQSIYRFNGRLRLAEGK